MFFREKMFEFFSLSQARPLPFPASRKRPLSLYPPEDEGGLLDPAKIAKHENKETKNHTQNDDDFFIEIKDEDSGFVNI